MTTPVSNETPSPSRDDPTARSLSGLVGGPVGLHARLRGRGWRPVVVLWLITTAVFAAGLVQKAPCHDAEWPRGDEGHVVFSYLCYSDVPFLYRERGFAEGHVAYVDRGEYPPLEYPVLTGAFMQLTATITTQLGDDDPAGDSARFFELTAIGLFACALVVVWATSRTAGHRPYDAMMVAAAPSLALTGVINWDLLAVALAATALLAWSRHRVVLAGLLLGLATAAKFYPLLFLGPLFVLALRSARLRHWTVTAGMAVVGWLVVNLPIALVAFDSWTSFWTFNEQRGAEFGSAWYVLELAGLEIGEVNFLAIALFAVACAGIGALALCAPRRPRLAQLVFLTVAAFLLVNKVYSPQYVLWLLPLLALARPRWRDWIVWQAGELVYWLMIWLHLGGDLGPASGAPDPIYWVAVGLRLAVTGYLCVLVVRDILQPSRDLVRVEDGIDDPGGGLFDQADDARWRRRDVGAHR